MKAQPVRALDVVLIGPVMIAAALSSRPSMGIRAALLGFGLATIVYNLGNYLRVAQGGQGGDLHSQGR